MRDAGRRLAECIALVREQTVVGVTTAELDRIFAEAIKARGCVSAFLGYQGVQGSVPFPATICASRNEQVVHGFPDDVPLKDGDIISLDFGLVYGGFFADSAYTLAIGDVDQRVSRLLDVTEQSLYEAISCASPGARVGDIGHRVQTMCEAEDFGVIREYVGHGIGRNLHEEPSVPNYGKSGTGVLLKAGMCLAIEPMITTGSWKTKTLKDGWTVVTSDGSQAAHFEHTVLITPEGPEILTAIG